MELFQCGILDKILDFFNVGFWIFRNERKNRLLEIQTNEEVFLVSEKFIESVN